MQYIDNYKTSPEYNKYSSQINKYFNELSQLSDVQDEKTFSLLPKAKILTLLWKILGNLIITENPDIIDEAKLDLRFYSVEVTDKLNECIKTYINQNYKQKNIVFSQYLIDMEVQNIFRLYKAGHQILDPFGFTYFNSRKVFMVKRYYNEAISYGMSEEEAIKRVAVLTSLSVELTLEYLERSKIKAISNDYNTTDEEGTSKAIVDIELSSRFFKSPIESSLIAKYEFERYLDCIQYSYNNKVKAKDKKVVSQLLTVYFLKPYTQVENSQTSESVFSLFSYSKTVMNYNWIQADNKYSFLDKQIIKDFPQAIPSFTVVAENNGITKMNANAKLNRILDIAKQKFIEEDK